jgi:hypothetical protein
MMVHPVKPIILVGIQLSETLPGQSSIHRTSLKVPNTGSFSVLQTLWCRLRGSETRNHLPN